MKDWCQVVISLSALVITGAVWFFTGNTVAMINGDWVILEVFGSWTCYAHEKIYGD